MVAWEITISGSALASNDSATYSQLFQNTIINNAEVSGDLAKAEAYTDCHMSALGAFSGLLQGEVFAIMNETNSYEEARATFSRLIALEMAVVDARKQTINATIEQSKSVGDACLAGVEF